MNEVTAIIKLRAVWKGIQTGWADVVGKHDNSFWISFGQAEAVVWVQAWLLLCMLSMACAFIGGVANLIIHWGDSTVLAACAFGMVLAFIQVWILGPPTWYVLRGRKFKISLRHTEVLVLLGIGIFVVIASGGNVFTFKAFEKH